MLALRIGRRFPGMTLRQSAAEWDERLADYTFYRFMNEIRGRLGHYFETTSVDASQYIEAKFDLLGVSGSAPVRTVARALPPLLLAWKS
jgi:hypothetical protein